jgi:branched-chain amino acid transport system ATP-binding protein
LEPEVLAVEGINSYYGDSHILHDVSLSLPAGTVLGLLGRNGAGKTTCIHSIIGFVQPQSGSIRLFGEAVEKLPPEAIAHAGVGFVPQGRRIFPSLTVLENLTVAARRPKDRTQTVTWDLERVFETFPRLQERLKQSAGTLSGGEQQMLAIARALMTNPRVLLLDEPSEGLAPRIVSEVAAVLAQLKDSGLSIIVVEQNTKLALQIADDVVVLNTGQVAWRGTAEQIRDDEKLLTELLGVY